MEIAGFTPEQATALWQDYLTRQQLHPGASTNLPQRRPIVESARRLQGKLDGTLAAATAFADNPATATMSVWRRNNDGDMEDSGEDITVTNRSDCEFDSGDPVEAYWIDGEWHVTACGAGAASAETCLCTCIDEGDLTVDGVQTTSAWQVTLTAVVETQANGSITFPAGTYTLEWDNVEEYWVVNVGDVLTAAYTSGADATSATTMDADLIFRKNNGGYVTLTLAITGTVPAE